MYDLYMPASTGEANKRNGCSEHGDDYTVHKVPQYSGCEESCRAYTLLVATEDFPISPAASVVMNACMTCCSC